MKIDFLKKVSLMTAAVLLVSSIVGCGNKETITDENIETEVQETGEREGMQTVTDSVGRSVEIPDPVTKAVVANAYNTEIINAIDALDCVIGVDYNIYQDKESWKNRFTEDMVIGKSQKDLNYEKIILAGHDCIGICGHKCPNS